jgi:hypothetical protein
MGDELLGESDSTSTNHGVRDNGYTSPELSKSVRAIAVALQADGRVMKPAEAARLSYMLQYLITHDLQRAVNESEDQPPPRSSADEEAL